MTDGFASIIAQLERQKTAIERALEALREVEGSQQRGTEAPAPGGTAKRTRAPRKMTNAEPGATPEAPAVKARKFSAAARKNMALAQKARWAAIKGETAPTVSVTPEPEKPKSRISPEGSKRIIAANRKRWRLQRAAEKSASAKKKASPK